MTEQNEQPDRLTELSGLPRKSLISVSDLAQMLKRSEESIRRAIDRHELPAPFSLCSKRYWTVGHLLEFFEQRSRGTLTISESEEAPTEIPTPHRRYVSPLRKV